MKLKKMSVKNKLSNKDSTNSSKKKKKTYHRHSARLPSLFSCKSHTVSSLSEHKSTKTTIQEDKTKRQKPKIKIINC